MSSTAFPYWSEKEFDQLRQQSRRQFVDRYSNEVQAAYREILDDCRGRVELLLAETDDLRALREGGSMLDARRDLLDAARYCTSPVMNADILKTVGESTSAGARSLPASTMSASRESPRGAPPSDRSEATP